MKENYDKINPSIFKKSYDKINSSNFNQSYDKINPYTPHVNEGTAHAMVDYELNK